MSKLKLTQKQNRILLPNNIHRLCEDQEMQITELAIRAGINPSYLSNLANNWHVPSIIHCNLIANGLGCKLEDVFEFNAEYYEELMCPEEK
ncbi:MAG: helix-turn-helix transcriptional regulator [Methylococcaceae bacterium]